MELTQETLKQISKKDFLASIPNLHRNILIGEMYRADKHPLKVREDSPDYTYKGVESKYLILSLAWRNVDDFLNHDGSVYDYFANTHKGEYFYHSCCARGIFMPFIDGYNIMCCHGENETKSTHAKNVWVFGKAALKCPNLISVEYVRNYSETPVYIPSVKKLVGWQGLLQRQ